MASTVSDNILIKLQKDIEEIKTALLGNEYNPEGLLSRTTCVENELEKLKARYERTIAYAAGAGAAVSLIVSVVVFLVSNFIK